MSEKNNENFKIIFKCGELVDFKSNKTKCIKCGKVITKERYQMFSNRNDGVSILKFKG